jgi:rhodanese-related sulfurtransferase
LQVIAMSAPDLTNNRDGSSLYLQAAGILAAAVLLGLVYNESSPLGLRAPNDEETKPVTANVSTTNAKLAASATIASNIDQTVTKPIESNNPAPPIQNPVPPPAAPATSFGASQTPPPPGMLQISSLTWPQVKSLIDSKQIVLLDARVKANYDIAHIPSAMSLPATSLPDELQAFAANFPKSTHFVTYCGSASCHMSHSLAESLVKICGFTNVSEMPGGYAEYLAAGAASNKAATP